MAEALISTILQQLASLANQEVKQLWGFDEEVKKLTRNFQAIQAVLEDAESRQVKEKGVANWLDKLKDASYDIDDVLDEWNTAIRKLQMKQGENASKLWKQVCSSISSHCLCSSQVSLRHKIALQMKSLNETLGDIAMEKNSFNFSMTMGTRQLEREITTSMVDALEVCGREHDENKLVSMLLSESSQGPNLSIISIIGMGGIGKTTLARLAFNNNKINTHFDQKIWVCVSDPFDEFRIAKAILESLKGATQNLVELENLLKQIGESIKEKEILLVLDDVWIEDSRTWEQLKNSIKCASQGSRILVTTRKESTAKVMGTTNMIPIGKLSDEESWLLFSQLAFSGKSKIEYENLKDIGEKIVDKCDGLPLAIKTLGSLLSLKTQIEQWENILNSELWKLQEIEKRLFPPILLSYYDLSSKLRKCFLYCAIFPKDYNIEKEILIKLWMAQNYLDGEGNHDMELVGGEYFENLVKRSFFQDFERSEYDGSIIRCKMHDIVHDFAQFLTKNECFIMEVDSDVMSYEKVRHLMINGDSIPLSIYNQKNLRTLFIEYSYVKNVENTDLLRLFEQLKCLRTLSLKSSRFSKLPKEIKHLVHLRYLSLSRNYDITELPEKLCGLYNLQTLDLTDCWHLQKLPQGIGKLVNLRHLLTDGTDSLSYMPRGIDRLTRLRTLNKLIISGDDHGNRKCRSLECLKNLDHRQGSFVLEGLGNVRDVSTVKPADFKNKKNLIALSLSFDKGKENRKMDEENEVILEALQTPPNLEKLWIQHYEGKTMSFHWMISLTKLKELKLDNCINFKYLPSLGNLPSLESLYILNMKNVKKVGNEFLGIENDATSSSSIVAFPKLTYLLFGNMNEWEEWNYEITRSKDEDITIMPCLYELSIRWCNKLKALPDHILQSPTLQHLTIYDCSILEQRYKKETGEDWCKIAHIPNIEID